MEDRKPLILCIETATNVCSVALIRGDVSINSLECKENNAHSKMLATLTQKVFENTYFSMQELSAVAISRGPGSYTGLRIGASMGKGIAFGLNIPLIAVDTLQILAKAMQEKYPNCTYLPMIDARRMEVYSCLYNENLNPLKEISADIVESDLYERFEAQKIILAGDGAEKCKQVLTHSRYILDKDIYLQAKYMKDFVFEKYKKNVFENTAYFEPYYLKNFIAIKSKVKGLYN